MRMLQVRVLLPALYILYLLYVKSTFTLKEDSLKAEFEVDLIAVTTLVKLKVTFIGELAERFKAAVLKTVDRNERSGSSNLSLPAK